VNRINCTRLILGGLLAGLIIDVGAFLIDGLLLADRWAAAMQHLGLPAYAGLLPNLFLNLSGFLYGIFALWLYANLRPRFGARPRTAVIAGFATWLCGSLLASVVPMALHMLPRRLYSLSIAGALLEIVLGTLAGAWLYKDARTESAPRTVATAA